MFKTVLQALMLLLCTACFCSCDQPSAEKPLEPVTLKFNLHVDSSYKYIIDSRLTLQPEVKGQTLNITQDIKIITSFTVVNANRFGKNIMINYDRIIMTSDNGTAKQVYDSDDTSNHDPIFAPVGGMLNKPYKLLVKDNGTVMTTSEDEDNLTLFSDSAMRKMVMQCLNIYPPGDVKPGDRWLRSYNTSTGFLHMHIENTFVLTSVNNNIAHIDINGKVTPEDSLQNMPFKGVQSGNMDVDINTGIILTCKISQQLSGHIGDKTNTVNATGEISIVNAK